MKALARVIETAAEALVIALLLSALSARAAPLCEPKTWLNPTAPGSQRVEHWTADGRVDAWWCPTAAPAGAPAGTTWFRMANDGGLWALGWQAVQAAAPRVLAASSPWQQLQTERAAILAGVKPTAAQTCRVEQIAHGACVALQLARLPGGYPGAASRTEAMGATKCGPEPDCSAIVVAPVWRTPAGGSSVFPVVAGRLGAPLAGRRAPGAALCDLARLRIAVGSYTYGALAGGPTTEAVLCVQVAA